MPRPGVDTTLSVAVGVALLSGLVSITIPSSVATMVGVLLIIVGLMGLMPIVRFGLG